MNAGALLNQQFDRLSAPHAETPSPLFFQSILTVKIQDSNGTRTKRSPEKVFEPLIHLNPVGSVASHQQIHEELFS
ncbi:hypothetical protein D3C71_2100940 [compost metagenome]